MKLKSYKEIKNWLSSRSFFEWTTLDITIISKSAIKINICYDDKRNKYAGEEYLHWDVILLITGIKEIYKQYSNWNGEEQRFVQVKEKLELNDIVRKINDSEVISIKDADNLYGLYFDDYMEDVSCILECKEIEVKFEESKKMFLKPELSKTTISFTYLIENFPNSKFWINKLEDEGIKCSFAEYFLNPVDINEVPEYDYENWVIRPLIEKGKYPYGLKIMSIKETELTKKIKFQLQEITLTDFFEKIKLVASKRSLEEVKCGNVLFTKQEWEQYLENKNN